MMKKWLLSFMSLFTALVLVVGCSNDSGQTTTESNINEEEKEVQEEIITVTISKDEGAELLSESEIEINEKAILMDVMKENFDIEEDGGFINAIDGIGPVEGEEKAWMYFVNDEMAMVGAGEYELSNGDEVNFDFQPWE